jgi:SAM-dependent methyltransferase
MEILKRYTQIPKEDWEKTSQPMELNIWKNFNYHEDRNTWWKGLFEAYKSIEDEAIHSILEVGCGPFAKNTQFVIDALKLKPKQIFLNDPLLNEYIKLNKPVVRIIKEYRATIYSTPLEECIIEKPVDMIICINVLDHVFNIKLCFEAIYKALNPQGILIFGNDLTNDIDFNSTPKNDPYGMLHPIRFEYDDINGYLKNYSPMFDKISTAINGYHYGTLFFIGKKK